MKLVDYEDMFDNIKFNAGGKYVWIDFREGHEYVNVYKDGEGFDALANLKNDLADTIEAEENYVKGKDYEIYQVMDI